MATEPNPPAPQVQVGAIFDIPVANAQPTQYYDQLDTTEDLTFTLPQTSESPINGIQNIDETDVVLDLELELEISQDYTAGTGQTLTASPWAPYNLLRNIELKLQNVYSSIDVKDGMQLAFINAMRPFRHTEQRLNLGANPAGYDVGSGTAYGYFNPEGVQSPLQIPAQYSPDLASYNLIMRLPLGVWFDEYWRLDPLGIPVSNPPGSSSLSDILPPMSTFVSPLYMASANKVVNPNISLAPPFGAANVAPVFTTSNDASGDTPSTFSGSGSLSVRRYGVRGGPSAMPPPHAWQYQVSSASQTIGSTTHFTYRHDPSAGQILSSTLILFDPLAGAAGSPLPPSQIKRLTWAYGSGVVGFQGSPSVLQRRFLAQHGFLPPPGYFCQDNAVDQRGRVTNRIAAAQYDTYNTTGIGWSVDLNSAGSAQTIATLLTESLRLVQ